MTTGPTELDTRARALHAWFCAATGQQLPLRMDTLTRWIDWLKAGHNGRELARVIRYLRREIAAKHRNPGCLKLSSLLDIPKFDEDLGLASMAAAGKFDPESKLSPLPQDERPAFDIPTEGHGPQPKPDAAPIRAAAASFLQQWKQENS